MSARKPGEDPQLAVEQLRALLKRQQEDQASPSADSVLIYDRGSKTGTWKFRKGRITAPCLSRIQIEEILYLMERASITCLDEEGQQLTVKQIYAELVDSDLVDHKIAIVNEVALRNYIAYGHLRRRGFKVTRSNSPGYPWTIKGGDLDCNLPVKRPTEVVDAMAERTEHACVVEQGQIVFLKLTATNTPPRP